MHGGDRDLPGCEFDGLGLLYIGCIIRINDGLSFSRVV